jgi:hypothetical protein
VEDPEDYIDAGWVEDAEDWSENAWEADTDEGFAFGIRETALSIAGSKTLRTREAMIAAFEEMERDQL